MKKNIWMLLLLSSFLFLFSIAQAGVNDGLVAYYPFNGNANDASGNGNNGVVNGATLIEDRFGNHSSAYNFDGNDKIIISDNAILKFGSSSFSISFWIITSINQSCYVIDKDYSNHASGLYRFRFAENNPDIFFQISDANHSSYATEVTSAKNVKDGKWHHVVGVRDIISGEMRIYVDGESEGTVVDNIIGSTDNNYPLVFGGPSGVNNSYFVGNLDEVRIYNRVLTEDEINSLSYWMRGGVKDVPPSTPISEGQSANTEGSAGNPCISGESSPGPFLVNSGDFFHSQTDIYIPARGIPVKITRYYNSHDLYDGPFGHGWNMDYTTQLIQTAEEGTNYVTVRKGNGLRIKFTDNGDSTYTPPLGSHDMLVKNPDDTFTLNGSCGSCARRFLPTHHFNTDGSLAAIEDMNGNAVTIGYDMDGRISTVSDANGRTINFSYGLNGRVGTITDFSSPTRSWSYGYDEYDNLTSVTDPGGTTIQYQYGEGHNLTAIIDALGNTITDMTYNDDDEIKSFTDKGGSYQIEYDPVSQITRKTDPSGQVFSFNYDNRGNITNKLDPMGHSLNLTWDSNSKVAGKENPNGIQTAYTYDARGNVLTVTKDVGGLNLTTIYEYDNRFDKVMKIIPPLGASHQTVLVYDDNGNLTERQTPGSTSYYTYDSFGNNTQIADPDGYITAMEYDGNGYPTRVYISGTDPIIQTAYTHDARGNILTKTDPNGNTTAYTYDLLDRMILVRDPLNYETTFTYDANGNLILIVDSNGHRTRMVYDMYNQLIERIDGDQSLDQRSTIYVYDLRGNLIRVTDPLNRITAYEYDPLNQMVGVTDPMGHTIQFAYDESGNRLTQTDANGHTTTYGYDALNRLASVTDALGNATAYTYDADGRLLTVVDANSHVAATHTYNENGRLVTAADALSHTTSTTYHPSGRIATRTDANGSLTTYEYETLTGRLIRIAYAGGRTESFTQDLAGNIISISDSQTGSSVSYTYNELNRVVSETQLSQTLTYSYDAVGNRLRLSVPQVGDFDHTYDSVNRLSTLTNPSGQTTSYAYLANDLRDTVTYHNGTKTEYTYDPANRLTQILHRRTDDTVIASFDYTYDNMNNRLSVTEQNAGTIGYTYDALDQLTRAVYPDETFIFSYDPVGNRLTKSDTDGTTSYTYDDANRIAAFIRPDLSQVAYTFDLNGNTQSRTDGTEINSYGYDKKNQLRQITYPNATTNQYTYDPTGRRIRAVDSLGIRRFLYDGQNPLADISGDGTPPEIATSYTPSLTIDDLISMHQSGNSFYYLRDGINSVRNILTSNETNQSGYGYSPYGSVRVQTGSSDNLFSFTGRRVEMDSGLMYYRSRYYDPAVGRFLKKDRYKGKLDDPLSMHRYGYVKGNPVNWVDPEGLFSTITSSTTLNIDDHNYLDNMFSSLLGFYNQIPLPHKFKYHGFCGPGKGLGEWLVPEGKNGVYDFTSSCQQHDKDYANLSLTKEQSDIRLLSNAFGSCEDNLECRMYALIYYSAVSKHGDKAWENAQEGAKKYVCVFDQ